MRRLALIAMVTLLAGCTAGSLPLRTVDVPQDIAAEILPDAIDAPDAIDVIDAPDAHPTDQELATE